MGNVVGVGYRRMVATPVAEEDYVVALAESLGIRRLATRDVRHFAAVRLRDGRAFDLVVHLVSASFGFQHRAQLLDAPIERDALRVDFGAIHLVVVLHAELEADVAGRADLTLAARHRAVVLRDAPEHAMPLPAALRVMIDEAGAL